MEFIKETFDKKIILKQATEVNQVLIENNISKIEDIHEFLNSQSPLLLVNGFMGIGKVEVVNHAITFLNEEVITLKYNCFETTILDDILLGFFDNFKKFTAQGIIPTPKVKSENFTQKINAYFDCIDKPVLIVINSFEQILKDYKQDILDFFYYLSRSYKIKTIIISRKFDYADFKQDFKRVSINALEKGLFEKYLRENGIKQIGPLSDELYKYTRGYWFYTTLSIKIMHFKKLSLTEFMSEYTQSFQTFNDFILREALTLVDPVSGHLFRFLTIMRHPISIKLLQTLNLYDADRISYFTDNQILTRDGAMIYLQDYFKVIAENSIAENIAIKIHKNCVALYNTQLPLKPLERDLLISRQTMRKEIEYHNLYIPQKPVYVQKPIPQPEFIQTVQVAQPTIQEKDEKIKHISFVFETEADEMAIMNKIATSITKFVDISDKKTQILSEVKNLSLVELINLAKKEEQNFEYLKAVMVYQKALTLNGDDDYYTFLPTLYSRLAEAFKNLSDWFNAQKYFELAIEFFVSTGDTEKINEYKYEIANIFYITFKSDKAEKLLKEILSENVSINLQTKTQLLLAAIINIELQLPETTIGIEKPILAELYFKYALNKDYDGNIETAVKYYKKCVETSQDIKINTYLSSALTNLASIYNEDGKTELAVKYLHESLRLDELTKNYNGIYISAMKLAEINTEKTFEYLQRAKKCAEELNEPFYITSADIAIGDYFNKQKNHQKALEYYESAYKTAQNEFNKENLEKIQTRINNIKKVYNE